MLVIFVLGLLAGSSNLDVIAAMQQESGADWRTSAGLALIATALVAIVDGADRTGRAREFAMQREAMALEFSGRDLAVIDATEALRLLVWLNLIIAMFLPFGIAPAGAGPAALLLGLVCWVAKLLVLAAALALLRTVTGRMRPMQRAADAWRRHPARAAGRGVPVRQRGDGMTGIAALAGALALSLSFALLFARRIGAAAAHLHGAGSGRRPGFGSAGLGAA